MIQLSENVWRATKGERFCHDFGPLPKVIINLQTGLWEILFGSPNEELQWCLFYQIVFFDWSLSGIFPPKHRDVKWIMEILKTATASVYFHCRHNRERTGFIAAVYRMRVQGWTFERAYQEWRDTGCRWVTWKLWKRALRKWERA